MRRVTWSAGMCVLCSQLAVWRLTSPSPPQNGHGCNSIEGFMVRCVRPNLATPLVAGQAACPANWTAFGDLL